MDKDIIEEHEIPEKAHEEDGTDYSIRARIRESTQDDRMPEIEKAVNKLADLQSERKVFEDRADDAIHQMGYDRNIHDLKEELAQQIELRDSIRRPFENEIAKIDEGIEDISNQIVYAWDPSMKKTIKFPVGILTLRTTQSLDIRNDAALLEDIIARTSIMEAANKYISGFKKIPVKAYMGVHVLPTTVVELIPKTTVKLETAK